MAHFIQYIPRRIVTLLPAEKDSPWYSQQQPDDAGFFHPEMHVLTPDAVSRTIVHGDTIWVIAQLLGPPGAHANDFLPVALDARIEVDDVTSLHAGKRGEPAQAHRGILVRPGSTSRWFPLADATEMLGTLWSNPRQGHSRTLVVPPGTKIGGRFQSVRRLLDAEPLHQWECQLQRPFDFISYRHADGLYAAFRTAQALLSEGRVLFWDRWSLPRRLAERRETMAEEGLNKCLIHFLSQATNVYCVESAAYWCCSSYARREGEQARRLGTFRSVPWVAAPAKSTRDPWVLRASQRMKAESLPADDPRQARGQP